MKKSPPVTFKMLRIAEDDWQIVAECPGTETQYIKGLKSKPDVDEWLAGTRRVAWLRSQGYANDLRRFGRTSRLLRGASTRRFAR
jgi:hypothetical protein